MRKTIHRVEYERLRELLRATRLQRGVRQDDLAAELGVVQNFVSNVERGVRRIDVIELRDVCLSLGTDLVSFCKALEQQLASPTPVRKRATRSAATKRPTHKRGR
jgi:transcriptional regulator with XRE-family HTH domain